MKLLWASTQQHKQNYLCAQRRLIHLVWSESLLSAWRTFGRVHSGNSYQTARMCSLSWVCRSFCWFGDLHQFKMNYMNKVCPFGNKWITSTKIFNIYWAKVLTDHQKNCDNCFVIQSFGMNFGTLYENKLWHQSCVAAGIWHSACSLRMRIHIKTLKCMCNLRNDLNLISNHGNLTMFFR